MSVAIDEKRISNTFYETKGSNSTKTNDSFAIVDKSALSQSANALKDLPIDLSNSKFIEENSNFSFNFTFNESRFLNITANGYYSSKERNLSLNIKFMVEKVFYEGNEKSSKLYQIDFSINSSNVEIKSLNKKIEKENIYDFLNRFMNDLTKILNDDSKNLTGIVFDKEDLKELMGIGDKEVGKLLNEIFLMIQTMANIKKNKNPDAKNVLFAPKRISQNVTELKQTDSNSIDMNMSVKEISKNS